MTPAAFLAAILEAPDDDAPRVVYADWLEEHGEEQRATFIREQIELATLPRGSARLRELRAREWSMMQLAKGWDGELRALVKECDYRRGFVEEVTFRKRADFQRAAAKVFARAPVRTVIIEEPFFRFAQWARSPHLARLRGLKLCRFAEQKWDATALEQAIAPRQLAGLTALDVNENYYLGWAWGRALADADHLGQLTLLGLAGNGLGDSGVRALAKAGHLNRLEALDLRGNDVGPAGIAALAGKWRFEKLKKLDLGEDEEFDEENHLGAEGVRALTSSRWLTSLRVLGLRSNGVDDGGAVALAEWPGLAGLTDLELDFNSLTDAAVEALAASPRAANLQRLTLYGTQITNAGVKAVLRSRHLAGLIQLVLDKERVSDKVWGKLEERFGKGLNEDE